ncbi:ParB N-terminal domain-containing protein [Psychrobacter proteolyticus]|uniref:ParB N-terminal domain-containing protein n=1 Tax=Psychrobacter proteolyticus TaxID=147825 RepID=UPI00311FEA8B
MDMDEVFAAIAGETLEVYQDKYKLRSRILSEASQYIETDSSDWPPITFNWDLSKEGQRFSLDGENELSFKTHYPEGFILGKVELEILDKKLCHFSRRDKGELWTLGRKNSLAYLIVYLSQNRPISPPLVKPHLMGEVILMGGHHRYAIAKEIGEKSIPIYVEPKYRKEIEKIMEIDWIS